MKKLILLFVIAITVCACVAVSAPSVAFASGEEANLGDKFFSSGKIGKITEIYLLEEEGNKSGNENKTETIYMWLTQPDDLMAMFNEKKELGDEWNGKYKISVITPTIQIDCKVDDGSYLYQNSWDEFEYQEELPQYYFFKKEISVDEDKKIYGTESILSASGNGEISEAGFLFDIIKGNESDGFYFDLKNHTMTIRARYAIKCESSETYGEYSYFYSDWSDEVSIGKDGKQEKLVKPEKIEAPLVSDLKFVRAEKDANNEINAYWEIKVDYLKSSFSAEKYYIIYEEEAQPLITKIQYRVYKNDKWQEWKNSLFGNEFSMYSGKRTFSTVGVEQNDAMEVRVFLENKKGADSDYATLSRNAENIKTDTGSKTEDKQDGSTSVSGEEEKKEDQKTKCKVCGICPVQPLGICLFIWIAIALVVIIVCAAIFFVVKKLKKNKDEK